MEKNRFVAVVGCRKYFGTEVFRPGQRVKLVKEPENPYDAEAVKVELEPIGQVGYVANSVHTVPKGCCSAGRVYEQLSEEGAGTIRFIVGDTAIVELENKG